MGIEKGSVMIYEYEYWLFAGYGKDGDNRETYRLHGLNGQAIEVLSSKCTFLIAPSEMRL